MAKFKIGDRVKAKKDSYGAEIDKQYLVTKVEKFKATGTFWIWLDGISGDSFDGSFPESHFELVPTWQPKVGDRVRFTEKCANSWWFGPHTANKEGVIRADFGADYKPECCRFEVNTGDSYGIVGIECFEPLPVAAEAQPAALTIEAGKFYKTRDGRKVGPAFIRNDIATFGELNNWASAVWANDGRQSSRSDKTSELDNDIISEWVDEPAEQPAVAVAASNDNAAPAKFKVGDKIRHKSLGHTGHVTKIVGDDHAEVFWTNVGWGATDPFDAIELLTKPTPTAIVALIEDGQPKPATRPKIHTDQAAATAEAERLALAHPGQLFGVFVLADSKIADELITKTAVLRAA